MLPQVGDGASNGDARELTKKDVTSDQEVRWCPGCGDYAILANVQSVLPKLGVPRENFVFVSGIGCAARFPYYVETYGFHSIHGRAPAIATGISTARPELSVFVVTGDGDALSIGGNHLLHAMRRNVDLTVLMFNNQIYGLTKGQYSPTSEVGKVTKSTPVGSLDHPYNPVSLALGAEATFVARSVDNERQHLADLIERAAQHRGTSFIEIYQNCNIFNDGAFDGVRGNKPNQIRLEHGTPIRFGAEGEHGVAMGANGELEVVDVAEVGEEALLVHDAHRDDPGLAFMLSRLAHTPHGPTPIGLFRQTERPVYGDEVAAQLDDAVARKGPGDLQALLRGRDTWTV
ncbi:2-oxoacid:ferredoxin oxidoreductase subunit beta [Egibacter rhizosphaerae]|uniref:2-oxoacid:ferredoxin oxidoreductase subunit beta n=1 Tax=Egibacter rhizosphaerae TaxID=1670831 RepID=A0A411YKZ1_9ACTN|nr:2-oxoacid:ferredoxin oxidoreductase subunit beta [Egibacter rhizosphaerae]